MSMYRVVYEPYISETVEASSCIDAIIRVLSRFHMDWESAPLDKFKVVRL